MQKLKYFLLAASLAFVSFSSQAMDKPNIQVSAEGSIEVLPDYLQLMVNTERTGKSKANVKNEVDVITQKVIDAARAAGIKAEHIDASQISIQPQYEWDKSKRVFVGETVRRSVNIKLYDLSQYTALADALAKIDITELHQQGYGYEDASAHQNAALVKALNSARAKAELIAETMGGKLGKVYHVSESGSHFAQMPKMRMTMAMAADSVAESAAPLEIRAQTVSANVSVIFLLK